VKAQLLQRGAKTIEPAVLDQWEKLFNAFTPLVPDAQPAVANQDTTK
jgi:hypothetical protein